jgi:hypothetical protein
MEHMAGAQSVFPSNTFGHKASFDSDRTSNHSKSKVNKYGRSGGDWLFGGFSFRKIFGIKREDRRLSFPESYQ